MAALVKHARSAIKGVCRRILKIGELCNPTLLGWELWLTAIYTPLPHVCYRVRVGISVRKDVRINRREPQNWGVLGPRPLGWGVADPLKTNLLPMCVTASNLVVLCQWCTHR